jgi:hypothetical protein
MGMVAGRYRSVQWTVQGNSPEPKRELGKWLWDGCSRVTKGTTLPECIVGGNQTVVFILVWKTIIVTRAIVLERNYSSQQTEGNKRGQQGEYLHCTQLLSWSWD